MQFQQGVSSTIEGMVAFSALPNCEALRQRLALPITTLEEDIAIVSDNALSKESQMQAHHQDGSDEEHDNWNTNDDPAGSTLAGNDK
jgi:hypothetical protein